MLEPEEMRQWSRLAASLGKRAGLDDPEAVAQASQVAKWFMDAADTAARGLHGDVSFDGQRIERPYPWSVIASALEVSKSAVIQRLGRVC